MVPCLEPGPYFAAIDVCREGLDKSLSASYIRLVAQEPQLLREHLTSFSRPVHTENMNTKCSRLPLNNK